MARDDILEKQNRILNSLSTIPKKILSLHGAENITEFVLHDLCQENCFNLEKAAYFVNNPDFNCLKGVAGISTRDLPEGLWSDIWEQKEMFSTYMRNSPFNRKVRGLSQCSLEGTDIPNEDIIKSVSRNLGIEHPSYYSLDMKHGNGGLFIFEKNQKDDISEKHLLDGVSLLGFCPIF
ncbi:hypothetical protein ACFLYA_01825 [Candidatus Dependentiae bacterium]